MKAIAGSGSMNAIWAGETDGHVAKQDQVADAGANTPVHGSQDGFHGATLAGRFSAAC